MPHALRWRRSVLSVATAGSLLLLAACGGSDDDGDGQSAGTRTSDRPVASDTASPDTTRTGTNTASPTPSGSATLTQQMLESVLLTAEEVGGDFTTETASGSDTPLPCFAADADSLDEQVPPGFDASTLLFSAAANAQLSEAIKVYADADESSEALDVIEEGFGCPAGALYTGSGSIPIEIREAPDDAAAYIEVEGIDRVVAWEFAAREIYGGAAVAQYGASLILMTYAVQPGGDASLLPDPAELANAALMKVVNS